MTETVYKVSYYEVIDNHTMRSKTAYNKMFKTKSFKEFMQFIESKGLN